MPAVVARQVGVLLHRSAADPGCALYGQDEMRWTAGPRGWQSILGRSIRRTRWLYLPGRVPEREAQHEVQQEFLNECLATTVQAEIFASVTILANIAFQLILQSSGKSPNCGAELIPQTKQDPDQKCWGIQLQLGSPLQRRSNPLLAVGKSVGAACSDSNACARVSIRFESIQ
jgi:hypothetical protein